MNYLIVGHLGAGPYPDESSGMRNFEMACHRLLVEGRRDRFEIRHFFPAWPPRMAWPGNCEARAVEPVHISDFDKLISDLRLNMRTQTPIRRSVRVIGTLSRSTVQKLYRLADQFGWEVDTNGYAFLPTERLQETA